MFKTRHPRFSQLFFYDFTDAELIGDASEGFPSSAHRRAAESYISSGSKILSSCGFSEVWYEYLELNRGLLGTLEGDSVEIQSHLIDVYLFLDWIQVHALCDIFQWDAALCDQEHPGTPLAEERLPTRTTLSHEEISQSSEEEVRSSSEREDIMEAEEISQQAEGGNVEAESASGHDGTGCHEVVDEFGFPVVELTSSFCEALNNTFSEYEPPEPMEDIQSTQETRREGSVTGDNGSEGEHDEEMSEEVPYASDGK